MALFGLLGDSEKENESGSNSRAERLREQINQGVERSQAQTRGGGRAQKLRQQRQTQTRSRSSNIGKSRAEQLRDERSGAGRDLSDFGAVESTQELQSLADTAGLGERAEEITSRKGEPIETFFGGGVIQDTFDTLNALQYGVTGVLTGKGFKEGVRTRASFSDEENLGQHGAVGNILGIAADIAVDPLTYVAPATVVRKIPGATKAAKAAKEGFLATKIGDNIAQKLIYQHGADDAYKKLSERFRVNASKRTREAIKLGKNISKYDQETQQAIQEARRAGNLGQLPDDVLEDARPAFEEIDRLSRELVDRNVLDEDVYEETVGSYLPQLYREKESGDIFTKAFNRLKERQDIPDEVKKAYGEIEEAGYPTAKGLVQMHHLNERAKFFDEVANRWGKAADDIDDLEGMKRLPIEGRFGNLAGKYVPEPIARDLEEVARVPSDSIGKNLMTGFKFSKVILNPATHARNNISNLLLNNFEGLSPHRVDIYGRAGKELKNKGRLYKEAQEQGLGLNTFASAELRDLMTDPQIANNEGWIRKSLNKVSDIYQKEEEFAKMAQYIYQKDQGKSAEEAFKIAERATFNYAQVTPFIRRMRESLFGFPFITFTYKVTPQVGRTLAKRPQRISSLGKTKRGIEEMSDDEERAEERATEPEWVKDGFYVKLPFNDELGRSSYLDLSYIIPFGDMVTGELFNRGINTETGLQEGLAEGLANKAPAFQVITDLAENRDFFGNRIVNESDPPEQQAKDVARHLFQTMAPPLVGENVPGGMRDGGDRRQGSLKRALDVERKQRDEGADFVGGRNLEQEVLRNLGIKISPVDLKIQKEFHNREKRKALETFLQEEGVLSEFSRSFVPKEDDE